MIELILEHGDQRINLNQAPLYLESSFSMPEPKFDVSLADSNQSGRYAGSDYLDLISDNKNIVIELTIHGVGFGAINKIINSIQNILMRKTAEEKTYLLYRETDAFPAPIFGTFGAYKYFEIVFGTVTSLGSHPMGVLLNDQLVRISLNVKPYAENLFQQILLANSAMQYSPIEKNGVPEALFCIRNAVKNYITNPVFEFDETNWTPSAGLSMEIVYDKEEVLFGTKAMRIGRNSSAVQNEYMTTNVTVTGATIPNFLVTVFCKKTEAPSVVPPISVSVGAFGGGAVVTKISDDGWYKIDYTAVNVTVGTWAVKIQMTDYYSPVTIGGVMATEYIIGGIKTYNALVHKRTMNVIAGTGVPQTSQSANPSEPGLIAGKDYNGYRKHSTNTNLFTMIFTWRHIPPSYYTPKPVHTYFFKTRLAGVANTCEGYFDYTNNTVNFKTDSSTIASFSMGSPLEGDIMQVAFVQEYASFSGNIKLYLNGVFKTSQSFSLGASMESMAYLGQSDWGWLGMALFDKPMIAGEVLAYYNASKAIFDLGHMIDKIAFWDSGGNGHFWVEGVEGNVPADLAIHIDQTTKTLTYNELRISSIKSEQFLTKWDGFIVDVGSVADGNAIGAFRMDVSVGTTEVIAQTTAPRGWLIQKPTSLALSETEFYMAIRMTDAGSNLLLAPAIVIADPTNGEDRVIVGQYRSAIVTTTYKENFVGPVKFLNIDNSLLDVLAPNDLEFRFAIAMKRSSGSAANVGLDQIILLPRPLLRILRNSAVYYITRFGSILVEGNKCVSLLSKTISSTVRYYFRDRLFTIGDRLELHPGFYNNLIIVPYENGEASALELESILTISPIMIWYKPRWALV